MIIEGIHTHIISDLKARQPHSVKKLRTPKGETMMGRKGKK